MFLTGSVYKKYANTKSVRKGVQITLINEKEDQITTKDVSFFHVMSFHPGSFCASSQAYSSRNCISIYTMLHEKLSNCICSVCIPSG